jgi:cold-inducible RNA-binding protein
MGTRLFIGNLNFTTSEDDLRAALSEGGRTVKEVHIPSDRETGRPRGFAFAEMGNEADAKAAIAALDGQTLDGRQIKVNEAQPRPAGGGGGGGRGGFGGGRGGGGGGGRRERW